MNLVLAMDKKTVTVDVREDIRHGREPMSKIMNEAMALRPDEQLLLMAPFEPAPLIRLLQERGFRHTVRSSKPGGWEVLFIRQTGVAPAVAPGAPTRSGRGAAGGTEIVEVDARGLEPPQPLVKILESLATLPADAELRAWTDRRPMHLYAQIEERGFAGQSEEQPDGSYLTQIRRR